VFTTVQISVLPLANLTSVQTSSEKAATPRGPSVPFAPFNFALQVIAAFTIFIFGYVALFVSLMIWSSVCLVIARGIYGGAKKVRSYTMRSAPAKTFISADVALIPGLEFTAMGGKS
jgi:hypothetical protein